MNLFVFLCFSFFLFFLTLPAVWTSIILPWSIGMFSLGMSPVYDNIFRMMKYFYYMS